MLMTQGVYGHGIGKIIIRPWADGELVNDIDTKSDEICTLMRLYIGTMYNLGCVKTSCATFLILLFHWFLDFKNYWIGGYANDTGGVREWFWENHQKIGPFRPWADGKPDNTMDTISAIASFQRGWDDIPTNWLIPLMCEKKINFE